MFRDLIVLYINHDDCFLVNNTFREYVHLREAKQFIKNFNLFIKQCYIVSSLEKLREVKTQNSET